MIKLVPVRVESHAGFKADEYPKYFYLDNIRFEITEITDRWYQGDSNPPWPVSDYFRVETESGNSIFSSMILNMMNGSCASDSDEINLIDFGHDMM